MNYPGIKRQPDGKYWIRVKVRDPRTGRTREVTKTIVARNHAHANRIREDLRLELMEHPCRGDMLLSQYAVLWMRGKLNVIRPSTRAKYAGELDRHILPRFGGLRLGEITRDGIIEFRANMLQRYRPDTVRTTVMLLMTILASAVDEGRIAKHPGTRLGTARRSSVQQEPKSITADQLVRVLSAAHNLEPDWYAFFMLLAFTGLRFGEASALEWDDIDFARGVARIDKAQWQRQLSPTKTGVARIVPIVEPLARELKRYREALELEGRRSRLVFPARNTRGYRNQSSAWRALARVVRAADIGRKFSLHGFRHTFNNLMVPLSSGVVLRSITGHVSEEMTMHYSHVGDSAKLGAVGTLLDHLAAVGLSGAQGEDVDRAG